MGEDDQLADQADGEQLHSEYDEDDAEQQHRPVPGCEVGEVAFACHDRDQEQTGEQENRADDAEKPQRCVGESRQEEDREDVQQLAGIDTRPVDLDAGHCLNAYFSEP